MTLHIRYNLLFEEKMKEQVQRWIAEGETGSNKKKVLLEATPGYLFNPLVPERMRRVIPEAKLLVV